MGRVVLGQSNRNDFYLCEPNRTGAGGERIAVLSAVLQECKGVKEGVKMCCSFTVILHTYMCCPMIIASLPALSIRML